MGSEGGQRDVGSSAVGCASCRSAGGGSAWVPSISFEPLSWDFPPLLVATTMRDIRDRGVGTTADRSRVHPGLPGVVGSPHRCPTPHTCNLTTSRASVRGLHCSINCQLWRFPRRQIL